MLRMDRECRRPDQTLLVRPAAVRMLCNTCIVSLTKFWSTGSVSGRKHGQASCMCSAWRASQTTFAWIGIPSTNPVQLSMQGFRPATCCWSDSLHGRGNGKRPAWTSMRAFSHFPDHARHPTANTWLDALHGRWNWVHAGNTNVCRTSDRLSTQDV